MLRAGLASTRVWVHSLAALQGPASAQLLDHWLLTRSDASLRMLSMRAGILFASQVARHIMSTEACLQPDSQAVHTAGPICEQLLVTAYPGATG